jgi:hypothetical protein
MRRLTAAVCLSLLVVGCSETTPAIAPTTETTPPDGPVAANCASIPGSFWRSLDELPGGELPGGGVGSEHWQIEFKEGEARWWHTDVVLDLPYRCDDDVLTAGAAWREINPQMVDGEGGRSLLRWKGDIYEKVESFFDLP